MKKLLILPFLIGLAACSSNDKYWVDNWAFQDVNLDKGFSYTEIYFDDTAYVVNNQNSIVGMELYNVSNDSLFRLSGDSLVLIGKMELSSDTSMRLTHPDKVLHLVKIPAKDKKLANFKPFDSKADREEFLNGFDKRAEEFYITSGIFKTSKEYQAYLKSFEADSADEALIDIPEIK